MSKILYKIYKVNKEEKITLDWLFVSNFKDLKIKVNELLERDNQKREDVYITCHKVGDVKFGDLEIIN